MYFYEAAYLMKYFNTVFDIFLYEGVFLLFFSAVLTLLNDVLTDLFFTISISSVIIAGLLWIIGRSFHLFQEEDLYEES
jgi:hypothetical protein